MRLPDPAVMAGLFSPAVITVCGPPVRDEAGLPPAERDVMAQAVEKRRAEFAAGRSMARQALRQLGLEEAVIPVGPKREPLWPPGVVGSISHTRGFCGVAVARRSEVAGLGFDAERIDEVRLHLAADIAPAAEWATLQRELDGDPQRALALAFSARETFFKLQYPITGRWVDLLDVGLRLEGQEFVVTPLVDLTPVCRAGGSICGRFAFCGDYVLTGLEWAQDHVPHPTGP